MKENMERFEMLLSNNEMSRVSVSADEGFYVDLHGDELPAGVQVFEKSDRPGKNRMRDDRDPWIQSRTGIKGSGPQGWTQYPRSQNGICRLEPGHDQVNDRLMRGPRRKAHEKPSDMLGRKRKEKMGNGQKER